MWRWVVEESGEILDNTRAKEPCLACPYLAFEEFLQAGGSMLIYDDANEDHSARNRVTERCRVAQKIHHIPENNQNGSANEYTRNRTFASTQAASPKNRSSDGVKFKKSSVAGGLNRARINTEGNGGEGGTGGAPQMVNPSRTTDASALHVSVVPAGAATKRGKLSDLWYAVPPMVT